MRSCFLPKTVFSILPAGAGEVEKAAWSEQLVDVPDAECKLFPVPMVQDVVAQHKIKNASLEAGVKKISQKEVNIQGQLSG